MVCFALLLDNYSDEEKMLARANIESALQEFSPDEIRRRHRELGRKHALKLLAGETKLLDPSLMATSIVELPPNLQELLSTMTCKVCDKVPTPFYRYLCPSGHMFCGQCGKEQKLKHNSKCMISLEDTRDDKVSGSTKDKEIPGSSSAAMKGEEEPVHFPLCQNTIKPYPADPIFTAIWMNTLWQCPNHDRACNTQLKGYEFLDHIIACKEGQGQEREAGSHCPHQ